MLASFSLLFGFGGFWKPETVFGFGGFWKQETVSGAGTGGFWKRESVSGAGTGGFWKRETVVGAGTGGSMLASFAPLIALAAGDLEKLAELPRWPGFRHI